MTARLLLDIENILAATDVASYLDAQDAAVVRLGGKYEFLWHTALKHDDSRVRWEALQLVSLTHAEGHREVLEQALAQDSDPSNQECARALLFRSVVRDNVVRSGSLPPERLAKYVRDIREGVAARVFESRHGAGGKA